MYLASLTFLGAVLPLLVLYYCIPKSRKNLFLLCAGLLIYGWSSPLRLLIPLLYVGFDYGMGRLLERWRKHRGCCRAMLLGSVLLQCAGVLCMRWWAKDERQILFPLGIAFFTLMGLGYLINIYRGKHAASSSYLELALYLTFFPVLYAGPIVAFPEFSAQLKNRRSNILHLGKGLGIFIRGLAEKVMLADTLWYIFQELRQTNTGNLSFLTSWLTVTAFSLYLYFELLGYSEMGRGLAQCFGFSLPKNFRAPFFSSSVTAFTQNWNISVGLWFQQYFRKFLFGKAKSSWLRYGSVILMWMIIGLWYGTKPQFLLWGMLIGACVVAEQIFLEQLLKHNFLIGVLYTAIVLQFSWVLFFAGSMGEVWDYWKAMIGLGNGIVDRYGLYYFSSYVALLLICFYIATDLFQNITDRIIATTIGQKLQTLLPLGDCALLIFCIASMLYTKQMPFLWLQL